MIPELLRRHQTWWQCAVLVMLGLIAFWPSVSYDFVNWDDPAYIEYNDLIKGWSWSNLKGIATEVVTRNYAPITIFSFLIDYTLWGTNPCGYHATNILLHLANGLLVFFLMRRVTGSVFVGWLTAALFLIHPIQIESVVWISSRKGLLCSLFMLSALMMRMKPDPDHRDDLWYLVFLALALFSKAHAIVLPPIVLLYDMLIHRQALAKALPRQFIAGLMSLLLLLMTMGAQNTVLGGVRGHMSLGLMRIIAVDITILWQYMGMMVCPTSLCVMYDPPTSGIWKQVLAGSLGWAIVAAGLWRVRRSHPMLLLGAFSFLLLLFPMLNFFRITTLMNDRYLYLPCIIVFAAFASLVNRLLQTGSDQSFYVLQWIGKGTKATLSVCILAACLLMTLQHMPVWRNSQSLWTHALTQYPDMPILRIQNALTVYDSGQVREAVRLMSLALLQCQPDELDRERMQQFVSDWNGELSQRKTVAKQPNMESSESR